MFRSLLNLTLCLLAAAPAVAADKVVLNYGWEPGISAKVTGTQSKEKVVAGQSQGGMRIDISYVINTKAHPQGITVDYQDVESNIQSGNAMMQSWMKDYIEIISSSIPSYIVNPKGEMVGAVGVSEMRELMLKSLDDLFEDLPPQQKQQIVASIGQSFTEEVINGQLQGEWNMYVGQWLGAEFEDDGVYEAEFDTPVPALGNQRVKTAAQYEFSGRVNCDDADNSKSCVKLRFHSETDNVSAAELLTKMVPSGQPVPDIEVSVVADLELITDPNTLLPYYSKLSKRSSAPIQTPSGSVSVTQINSTEFTYLYVKDNK